MHTYYINGLPIPYSDEHKCLGVILSSNLSWSKYYHNLVCKAYKSLGMIRRTFTIGSISTKRQLYLALIRSQLSYCSVIWRPHQIKHIKFLEAVQRHATKYILQDYTSDYKSRLKSLLILPLMYYFEICHLMFFMRSVKDTSNHLNIITILSPSPAQIPDPLNTSSLGTTNCQTCPPTLTDIFISIVYPACGTSSLLSTSPHLYILSNHS